MKTRIAVMSAVGAALLTLAVLAAGRHQPDQAETLTTVPVSLADIESSVMATGALQPGEVVDVNPQVSGQLVEMTARLGDRVTKGQIIGKIDSRQLNNALRGAQNALQRATTQRAINQVQLSANLNNQTRQHALRERGVSSVQKLEEADNAVRTSQTNLRNAELGIQSAQIALEQARADLERANVRAPIDGVVAEVVLREGSTVNLFTRLPVIVRVAKMQTMTVSAQISEADIPRISEGQPVYFNILGDAERRYHAKLRAVEFTPSTGTLDPTQLGPVKEAVYYNALFDVPNPDGRLLPGMTANVHVILGQVENVPAIPLAALGQATGDNRYLVQVQDADGEVETRQITAGLSDQVNIEVRMGLKNGDRVVVADAPPVA